MILNRFNIFILIFFLKNIILIYFQIKILLKNNNINNIL